ncbi:hypothetical protein K0M31_010850, partial [Melipona bicolor]
VGHDVQKKDPAHGPSSLIGRRPRTSKVVEPMGVDKLGRFPRHEDRFIIGKVADSSFRGP